MSDVGLVKDCTTRLFCLMCLSQAIEPSPAIHRLGPAFQLVTALPGGRMHRLLTTLKRGFTERIGWKRLGVAASLLIIAFAVTTLVRTLKGVDTGVILVALREKSPSDIALAALCVVGAFCTLTFYD